MLKFIDIYSKVNSNVEIDYYVPFTIDIKENEFFNENSLYWRTGNFDTSLLEIEIGEKSGILKSITLTSVNQITTNDINFKALNTIIGAPILDISRIKNKIYDYVSEYIVSLTINNITVNMSTKTVAKTIIKTGRITLGFGFENELMFITINNLSSNEYKDLKDSFRL
ncbi:hypothetical protein A9G41_11860 [Gilliamella sp. Nev5-1]|uniref:hypothetical protein n=1 Tax=Gilliamella sp. Nev5-1 TaxID=3120251 RepID=UPI000827C7E5|nr:hypothetical protein [Gilliamella apicola]OCG66909.1 hypothetical protein A9G41_11860 [Gilliamella apicola]